ncbi:hypothetical protein GJ744_004617 [Endocarpon pusillum]|uniref:Uncharacterized protein n=1 Tax=Endocarpon pusillum TaxID=364733 RepID=A0A8H7ALU8_9EURO|nr:hypothetical protein GJ744_004617 [Endocarpon pusillum]
MDLWSPSPYHHRRVKYTPLDSRYHQHLHELDCNQKVRKAEMFALANLIYKIVSGTKPFEDGAALLQ